MLHPAGGRHSQGAVLVGGPAVRHTSPFALAVSETAPRRPVPERNSSTLAGRDHRRIVPSGLNEPKFPVFFVRNVKRDLARLAELSLPGSIGETPQPAAAGAHSKAGMGHCREETMSNSNFLGVHSGLEQAHEARRGPQLAL
jgi:hypothetical protein